MKKLLPLVLLLLIFVPALAEDDWSILQMGWWNAPLENIVQVRDQLRNYIYTTSGYTPVPGTTASSPNVGMDDWSILRPGWWSAAFSELVNTESQLSNHIAAARGELAVVGQATAVPAATPVPAGMYSTYATAVPVYATAVPYATPLPAYATAVPNTAVAPIYGTAAPVYATAVPVYVTPIPSLNASVGYSTTNRRTNAVIITSTKEANIRAEPNSFSTIYGRGKPGEVFECLGVSWEGWYKIRMADGITTGYISPRLAAYTELSPSYNVNSSTGVVNSISTNVPAAVTPYPAAATPNPAGNSIDLLNTGSDSGDVG